MSILLHPLWQVRARSTNLVHHSLVYEEILNLTTGKDYAKLTGGLFSWWPSAETHGVTRIHLMFSFYVPTFLHCLRRARRLLDSSNTTISGCKKSAEVIILVV